MLVLNNIFTQYSVQVNGCSYIGKNSNTSKLFTQNLYPDKTWIIGPNQQKNRRYLIVRMQSDQPKQSEMGKANKKMSDVEERRSDKVIYMNKLRS